MHHQGYLNGRLLLAGVRWSSLSFRDRLDVAYAALIEPMTNGGSGLQHALDTLDEALILANPTPENVGTDPRAQRNAAYAESMFAAGGAANPTRRRSGVPESAGSG